MNRIALLFFMLFAIYMQAQSKKDSLDYVHTQLRTYSFGVIPAVEMSDHNVFSVTHLANPIVPPVAWKVEFPNGFEGSIVVTIPNTDTSAIKSHFIYRGGKRTKLIIKRK